MFTAIKDNKIIAISDTDSEFPCLVCDMIANEPEHTTSDYVEVGGEYVLVTDDKAIEKKKQARINELQTYLDSTDWYAVRFAETGVAIPDDVKTEREDARVEISKLRGDTINDTDDTIIDTIEEENDVD